MPTRRRLRIRVATSILVDLALPVGLYCGLRAFDVNQWLALALSEALPVLRLGYVLIRQRRLASLAVCTLVAAAGRAVITVASFGFP